MGINNGNENNTVMMFYSFYPRPWSSSIFVRRIWGPGADPELNYGEAILEILMMYLFYRTGYFFPTLDRNPYAFVVPSLERTESRPSSDSRGHRAFSIVSDAIALEYVYMAVETKV